MCTVQAAFFVKNGIVEFDCKAIITDEIEVDMVVAMEAGELGSTRAWVTIIPPDGIQREYKSELWLTSPGTYDFIVLIPVSNLGNGTYSIRRVEVFDSIGYLLCIRDW